MSSVTTEAISGDSTRAVRTYVGLVALLGAPLIVGMYRVEAATGELLVFAFMLVPTIAALLARVITGQRLTIGKPNTKTLALATIPALGMGLAYGLLTLAPGSGIEFLGLTLNPLSLVFGVLQASLLALGEEVGWRGYLLPQLRRTRSFLAANIMVAIIWLLYHVPVIFAPGLYSNPDIPVWASLVFFTVAIFGFSFFVGVLWEKHHDVWAPTFAHGMWNYLVQSYWPAAFVATSPWIMGEFGVVAGVVTVLTALIWAPRIARTHSSPITASQLTSAG